MNNAQRKEIAAIITRLNNFDDHKVMHEVIRCAEALEDAKQALADACDKAATELEEIQGDVENLQSDEQDKYDNMPEGLQGSEKGEQMNEGIDLLSTAYEAIGRAVDTLREDSDSEDFLDSMSEAVSESVESLENIQ